MLCLFTDSVGQPTGTGVQPPAYYPSYQMPPFPIFIIPYPLPIVPSPASCPCYLVNPGNETTSQGQSPQGQSPQGQSPQGQSPYGPGNQGQTYAPYGIIGYVPVLFVPYCPGKNGGMSTAQENFPNAVSVPYSCKQCQQRGDARDNTSYFSRFNNGRSVDFGELKKINSSGELEHFLKNAVRPSRKGMRRLSAGMASLRGDTKFKKPSA